MATQAEQDAGMLQWFMQLQGQDVNNPADVQSFTNNWNTGAAANPGGPASQFQQLGAQQSWLSPEQQQYAAMQQRAIDTNVHNQQLINGLGSNAQQTATANNAAINGINNINSWQFGQDNQYAQQTQGLATQLGGYRDTANNSALSALGSYQQGLGSLFGYNANAAAGLGGLYGQLANPLQSQVSYGGDLSSQAAQAYADPNAISAQNNALSFLNSGMNGGLDYQSQAAQAYANPEYTRMVETGLIDLQRTANGGKDVRVGDGDFEAYQRTKDGLAQLQRIAEGANNVNPGDIDREAYDRLNGIANGSLDVRPGQLDPAAYASATEALNKYKSLSDPTVTDAERFLYEQSRLNQEQQERANRGAVMSNLRQRGLSGSGMELTDAALANQQTSQNRLLSDLGANANAVARAQNSLAGWQAGAQSLNQQANALGTANADRRTDVSNALNSQANTLGTANADRRTGAAGAYAQGYGALNAQGNMLATANADRQLSALGMYTDQSGKLRSASFDEAYKRGIGADTASANNQQTRLASGVASGNLASNMRDSSFNEAFSRGSAADQTAQFNTRQKFDVQAFNSNYAQDERNSQWARGQGLADTMLTASGQNQNILNNSYAAQDSVNNQNYARNTDVIKAQDLANGRQQQASDAFSTRGIAAQGLGIANNQQNFTNQQAIAALGIGNQNDWLSNTNQVAGLQLGAISSNNAAALAAQQSAAAAKADAAKGILGTGIGGSKDPFMPTNWIRGKLG